MYLHPYMVDILNFTCQPNIAFSHICSNVSRSLLFFGKELESIYLPKANINIGQINNLLVGI
jgi:hypothetical protein